MTWYYEQGGERVGPVDEERFQHLLLTGTISPDTLVWKPGMQEWKAYRHFQAEGSAPHVPGQSRCVECGLFFDPSQIVQYGDEQVCAACKPLYTQRLIESGRRPTIAGVEGRGEEIRFAGFWVRVGAVVVDFLALSPLIGPLTYFYILGAMNDEVQDVREILRQQALSFGQGSLMTAIYIAYYAFMNAKYQASLGKMAFGLKIVRENGARISTKLAIGRAFAWELSSMLCNLGYLFTAFDSEKRALHDMICKTRVIYKPTHPAKPLPKDA